MYFFCFLLRYEVINLYHFHFGQRTDWQHIHRHAHLHWRSFWGLNFVERKKCGQHRKEITLGCLFCISKCRRMNSLFLRFNVLFCFQSRNFHFCFKLFWIYFFAHMILLLPILKSIEFYFVIFSFVIRQIVRIYCIIIMIIKIYTYIVEQYNV